MAYRLSSGGAGAAYLPGSVPPFAAGKNESLMNEPEGKTESGQSPNEQLPLPGVSSPSVIEARVERALEEEILTRLAGEPLPISEDLLRQRIREKFLHQIDQFVKELKAETREATQLRAEEVVTRVEEGIEPEFQRFNLNIRIQHIVLFTSVLILIFTGLPLKFYQAGLSNFLMGLYGGIDNSRFLHRIGATGLILVGLYHLIFIGFFRSGRRELRELLPRFKDFKDFFRMIRFFLGKESSKPRFGRFSYIEKFDYWAVWWGMLIMIFSGLVLWFNVLSMRLLPKFVLDIANEAHSDEGLLATLAIIIWHFYNVHLNPKVFPMSWTWWTGKISREDMQEHHPLELEKILIERRQLKPEVAEDDRSV